MKGEQRNVKNKKVGGNMEEKIRTEVIELYNKLDRVGWEISNARETLENLETELEKQEENQNKNTIKDIDNFKRELKREGLYTDRLDYFIEQYMLYYNK